MQGRENIIKSGTAEGKEVSTAQHKLETQSSIRTSKTPKWGSLVPEGNSRVGARHFVPFRLEDRGGGKGIGWVSKGFRCHLSIHRDCAGRTAAIKDLHNSNWEEERGVRERDQDMKRKKKAEMDKDRQETGVAMLVYLKRPHSIQERGRGEAAWTEGKQAEWVLDLKLKALFVHPNCTTCLVSLSLESKESFLKQYSQRNFTMYCILWEPPTHLNII